MIIQDPTSLSVLIVSNKGFVSLCVCMYQQGKLFVLFKSFKAQAQGIHVSLKISYLVMICTESFEESHRTLS